MSTVAVIFGSRSVEHEVSVITAHQAMAALSPAHRALPVYIAKDGRWFTGTALSQLSRFAEVDTLLAECTQVTPVVDPVRPTLTLMPCDGPRRGMFGRGGAGEAVDVDVAMPLVHGGYGEDGTLQGLLEMAGVPYTGSDVRASAVAMDKHLAKTVLRGAGLPVLDDVVIERESWDAAGAGVVGAAESVGPYPLYVKPATLGSSIGVSRVTNSETLREAIEVALTYDERCIVEPAQEGIVEVNCAVLGDHTRARASLLEQPTKQGLLSYDDKYRAGGGKRGAAKSAGMKGAQRIVPAPLPDHLAARIREAALLAFAAVGAAGVARVDFLVHTDDDAFAVNELNPIPGSLSAYLFEPDGLTFTALLDELIDIARRRHARRQRSTAVFDRWMLGGGRRQDRSVTAPVGEVPAAALLDTGSGRPLLLLHGWGATKELMAPVAQRLSGYRTVVPDLPGFGGTPAPPRGWGVEEYAQWVLALLDRLSVARADVVAHSNGGRIAVALAVTHPERVRRLVLTDSAGIRPRHGPAYHARVRTFKLLRSAARSRWLPASVRAAAQTRAARRGSADYRAASGALRDTMVRLVNTDMRAWLRRLIVPTLLIWGECDEETPLADGRLMERLIPDAGLVVFEGAGHFAYAEQPDRFCRIVDVFLRGDPP